MRKRYSPELKAEAISLFMASETVASISMKLAVPLETVRSWVYGRRYTDEKQLEPTTTILNARTALENQCLSERVKETIVSGTKTVQNLFFLIQNHVEARLRDSTPLDSMELNEFSNLLAKCSISLERISKVDCTLTVDQEEKMDILEIRTILKNDPFTTLE